MQGLGDKEIKFFYDEGYLMLPQVYAPADLQPLRDELTEVIQRESLRLHAAGKLSQFYEEEPFERRLSRIYAEATEIVGAIMGKGGGGHSGRALFEVITHPKLLRKVESFIGPEIVGASAYRIRPKIPGVPSGVVPWHQDSGYFSPHCDASLILTCWIPLVDATPENGCLQVLPRAHRQGVVRHFTRGPNGYLAIADQDLPPEQPVTVPVPLGGVLFLTNRTPHCSTPNTTDMVRWSIDLRYQSADLPNNVGEGPEDFSLDRPLHEIACYPPEADFVVQSRDDPDSVVDTWEEFQQIRQRYQEERPPGPDRGWVPMSEIHNT
jgi:phytanoyl-CoA hydroxylase